MHQMLHNTQEVEVCRECKNGPCPWKSRRALGKCKCRDVMLAIQQNGHNKSSIKTDRLLQRSATIKSNIVEGFFY